MKIINGGVTAAKGYKAFGVAAGVKKQGRNDMAMVYSQVPAKIAGVFTTNVVKAAPVKWDIKLVKENETAQAIILNAGIANACTGKEGEVANKAMACAAAEALGISTDAVLTASTGVIGMPLPVEIVTKGAKLLADGLSDSIEAGTLAAESIMTTDTYKKECAVVVEIDGVNVTIGGMTKGSGMIHPNMATMLCTLTTDIAISKELLQEALSQDVTLSFNMISVDCDTSTNDSYIIFANGLAGNKEITKKDVAYETFVEALNMVSIELSKMMAADGEGASKLLEAQVINASTEEQAKVLSKSIITSNLVKTAVFGSDANWGRIFCAMGYAGVMFDPDVVDLYIESDAGRLKLVEDGMATDYSEEVAKKILSGETITAIADMKAGTAKATAWGCDLTYDYVKINADKRS